MKIKSFLSQFPDSGPEAITTNLEALDATVNSWLMNKSVEVHHVKVVYVGDRYHRVGVITMVFYSENAG